ncbi:interleukin-21 [Gracilinanus agilis]|uniref:interleukin-21 n=1 Tax=Gracilinanus agilis TaxID=191870 RepID=UPI001CFE8AA1|nr:interleukin-21 [Gracilinanus agilis]
MERRVIYWLVLLFSGMVASKPSSPCRLQSRISQLVETVEQLKSCVNDTDPALVPTPENNEEHCEESAFKCFQEAQLKPSNHQEKKMRFDTLIKQLRRRLPWREANKTKPKCRPCDSFEGKSPQEFLISLRSFLQKLRYEVMEAQTEKVRQEIYGGSKTDMTCSEVSAWQLMLPELN